MVKVRSLENVPFSRYLCLCNYYVHVTSGPSILTESTDSAIITMDICYIMLIYLFQIVFLHKVETYDSVFSQYTLF